MFISAGQITLGNSKILRLAQVRVTGDFIDASADARFSGDSVYLIAISRLTVDPA